MSEFREVTVPDNRFTQGAELINTYDEKMFKGSDVLNLIYSGASDFSIVVNNGLSEQNYLWDQRGASEKKTAYKLSQFTPAEEKDIERGLILSSSPTYIELSDSYYCYVCRDNDFNVSALYFIKSNL